MNQGTVKNLRELLMKQQQNYKIKFKGDPSQRLQIQPIPPPIKSKQLCTSLQNNQVISNISSNNLKKNSVQQIVTPSLKPFRKNSIVGRPSQLVKKEIKVPGLQISQEIPTSKRAQIKSTSQIQSLNSSPQKHILPPNKHQQALQNLFMTKELLTHGGSMHQSASSKHYDFASTQNSRINSKDKNNEQLSQLPYSSAQQVKQKNPLFYHHIDQYLNNYYQRGSGQVGQQHPPREANSQLEKQKKQELQPLSGIGQKSIILNSTQTSFKLKKNLTHTKATSDLALALQADSAPVSPHQNPFGSSEKRRNASIHEVATEKTQSIQIVPSLNNEKKGKQMFKFMYVIGKGGFGRVWKVEMKKTRQLFAMKEMSKAKIIQKRSVNSVLNERYLLEHLYHPFLVNMSFAFYDKENLFLVMDLLLGGDLRFHLGKMRRFSENQSKFFVACILLPLAYLHQNGIIHRDLKPENLVLDDEGYMRLTDLGIARINKGNNAGDTSGTPGYMAPEVMCRMDHSVVTDYYALGVITYELMLGRRPYNGRTRQEIREQILARQVQVKVEEAPPGWSESSIDFVNRLIQRKPERRLGANGIEEIFNHPWLKNYQWELLLKRQIKALYVPGAVDDNFDFQNQISEETQLNEDQQTENQVLLRRPTVQSLFEGYHFDAQIQKLTHQETVKTSVHSTYEKHINNPPSPNRYP